MLYVQNFKILSSHTCGIEFILQFSYSTQLRFIFHINVNLPTIEGILTLISRTNTIAKHFKARKIFIFSVF